MKLRWPWSRKCIRGHGGRALYCRVCLHQSVADGRQYEIEARAYHAEAMAHTSTIDDPDAVVFTGWGE